METKEKKIFEICNNPLNIRYVRGQTWVGQTGEYKGFVKFASKYMCYRAALKLLLTYIGEYGLRTPSAIIKRWAPQSENDTQAYIDFVCSKRATYLNRNTPLKDWDDVEELLTRMTMMETGKAADRRLIHGVIEDIRAAAKAYSILRITQMEAFNELENGGKNNPA